MLVAEAIIAEIVVTLIIIYSVVKRNRSSEGVGAAVAITAALLFIAIPITYHFMS